MYTSSGNATTAWTSLQKTNYGKIVEFELTNDETSGSGLLYFAFNSDTSATQIFGLKWGESILLKGINVNLVRIKSSASTIAYRARYH